MAFRIQKCVDSEVSGKLNKDEYCVEVFPWADPQKSIFHNSLESKEPESVWVVLDLCLSVLRILLGGEKCQKLQRSLGYRRRIMDRQIRASNQLSEIISYAICMLRNITYDYNIGQPLLVDLYCGILFLTMCYNLLYCKKLV